MKPILKKIGMYAIVFVWFILSLLFFEYFLNRGNTDLTKEMAEASLPVCTVRYNGHDVNKMFGYIEPMNYSLIRDGINPLNEGRKLDLRIYRKDSAIENIAYELRSVDKERFVEEGTINDYKREGDYIDFSVAFKDIIKANTEYELIIDLTLKNDKHAYYYARVIDTDEMYLPEKIDYVYSFSDTTFDKDKAQFELTTYLESNASGDNTDFGHVDIHSSLEQVTWGNLDVKKVTEPVCTIRELDEKSAQLKLEYVVSALTGEENRMYRVTEYYRFIKGSDRMYLLEFDRYMNTFLFDPHGIVYNDKLMLGVTDEDYTFAESEDGNTYAFINNGSLFIVNSPLNTFGTAYSFYFEDQFDDRTINNSHNLKILNIDESGNVVFCVYGYFNRGDHEGRCGINLFEYNAGRNVVTEKTFISVDEPYEVIKRDLGSLSYYDFGDYFYFYLDKKVVKTNVTDGTYEILADDIDYDDFFVSLTGKNCAWISKKDSLGAKEITFFKCENGTSFTIDATESERLRALGFMGDDLIFGKAYKDDVSEDVFKEILFPMFEVNIESSSKGILKTYKQDGIYVTNCKINDNLITLSRMEKDENGAFVQAPPDSIVNTLMEKVYKNNSEVIATENLKKIVQVTLKKEMDNKKTKYLTPKTEMYEGKREIVFDEKSDYKLYYAFKGERCLGIYTDPSDAVVMADSANGSVIDQNGHYIWEKENYRKTNQIMKITSTGIEDDASASLERSLEKILEFEGYALDVKANLNRGESLDEIIEGDIPSSTGISLHNVAPEVIKYYLNKDIPVIAVADNNTVLIIGYSDSVYVWYNPQSGNIMKVGIDEANKFYENYGNNFFTYKIWDS